MRHLAADATEIETRRDDVWLWLYEGLGWATAAEIDFDDLVTRVRKAVELERLRAAGWSEADLGEIGRAMDVRDLLERGRPAPGETFDRSHWVGPLAEAIEFHLCDLAPHPYLRPVDSRVATPQHIRVMLEELGAPELCTVGELDTPGVRLSAHRREWPRGFFREFEEGSRVPLGAALEIAEESGEEAELYCLPGRLAYVQHHEIASAGSRRDVALRAIVYRPS